MYAEKMTNAQLLIGTIKWLAIMFVLAGAFYLYGGQLVEALLGVQLSSQIKDVIVVAIAVVTYSFGARELIAGIRGRKQQKNK
jgi:hypothetical protein